MTAFIIHPLAMPLFLTQHVAWIVAGLICAAGLILGMSDLVHFSMTRMLAIAGVCFRESIRRRVLWITPLAIIGVIIVAQLQRPADEQDAIRQTIKYCLFATGMLVSITTIILACTNLPKEIENRVIYTIVTKATTRLEIMIGKVAGFASVAAAILLIMGLFTLGYVELRQRILHQYVHQRLQEMSVGEPGYATLTHFDKTGLLRTNTLARPSNFQFFAKLPEPGDRYRWIAGQEEEEALFPYDIPDEMLAGPDNGGLLIRATIRVEPMRETLNANSVPSPFVNAEAARESGELFYKQRRRTPAVSLSVLDADKYELVPDKELQHLDPRRPSSRDWIPTGAVEVPKTPAPLVFLVPASSLDRLRRLPADQHRIYIEVHGMTDDWRYGFTADSLQVYSPLLQRELAPVKDPDGMTFPFIKGRTSANGQRLRGGSNTEREPVAVFRFDQSSKAVNPAQKSMEFELKVLVDRVGGQVKTDAEDITLVQAVAVNRKTGQHSEPIVFSVDSGQPAFFDVPTQIVRNGDFDLQLRSLTEGHWLNIRDSSLSAVIREHSFTFNLLKSLLILWLMALLISIVSIFCSTFVSWPIAVVLTVVILFGHWGAVEVGDTSSTGIARSVATDFFPGANPDIVTTVTGTVEGLSRMLNAISQVLPDTAKFAASQDIEQGLNIPAHTVYEALGVIGLFGIPLTLLGYIFLKRKEVAP